LRNPFANEILINPYTYGKDENIIQSCQEKDILLMAYSALVFNYVRLLLVGDEKLRSNKENFNMTSAHIILSF
jgi:diketogulonate reductase-like aldo/keto reductase